MSLFNTKYPNAIETRVKNSYAENVYQWNFDNEEFERVGAGGGGEIPYYCKTNSIKIDNLGNTSSTQVDDNSVDVVDSAANKSSSLLSDKLVFGDSTGNSELTKTTIAIANKLNQGMIEPVMNSNLPQYKLVAWDSTNNIFKRMDAIRIGSGVPAVSIMNNEFNMSGGVTFSIIRPNYLELKNGGNLLTANSNIMKISNGSAPFQSLHYTHSDFIIGSATNASGAVLDVTKNRLKLTNNEISFFDESTLATTAVNVNSFIASNRIRDMVAGTTSGTTKMVLYDTSNSSIKYTDIPTGVSLPSYIEPTQIKFQTADVEKKGITIQGNSIQVRDGVNVSSPSNGDYVQINQNEIKISRFGISDQQSIRIAKQKIGFYQNSTTGVDLVTDDVVWIHNQRNNPTVVYKFLKWTAPSNTVWQPSNPDHISSSIISGYTQNVLRFDLVKGGDTLLINLNTWNHQLFTGALKRGILFQMTVHDTNESPSINLEYIKDGVSWGKPALAYQNIWVENGGTSVRVMFIEFSSTVAMYLNGLLKVTLCDDFSDSKYTVTAPNTIIM